MDDHPVSNVVWVPLEQVRANEYNPNHVASAELSLLELSILHDGYTQPIVTVRDEENDLYVIVDGFHRYLVCRESERVRAATKGKVPVVVLDKPLADRMASTIRHNRARGKHAVGGMADLVYGMLREGWPDDRICREIGLEAEELLRLKHVTGYAKLFENIPLNRAWKADTQVWAENEWKEQNGGDTNV